jgi:hypothetical protein
MSILIKTMLDRVKEEFAQPEPLWEIAELEDSDLVFLKEECNNASQFDPTNKRKMMYDNMANGTHFVCVAKCPYGRIFLVLESNEQANQIPWGLWARILRLFCEKRQTPFKVFLLANTSLREFPPGDKPITPENINGGYTYRCNPETILIYRAEDATRVLIHELQHSCCLDNPENSVDQIEAETEAWAELIYIMVISQGKKYIFNDLLKRQSEWMRKQNEKVRQHMKNPDSKEFPWRYTIGKQEVWERWGILSQENLKPEIKMPNSLRLTYPVANVIKDRFRVSNDSTIL